MFFFQSHNNKESQLKLKSSLSHGLSAIAGACCSAVLVTPLDVVRVRQQAHMSSENVNKNPFSMMRNIVKNEGVFSLWRGLGSTFLMSLPSTGLYFILYEAFREKIIANLSEKYGNNNSKDDQIKKNYYSKYASFTSGGLARTVVVIISAPIELVKTNLQATAAKADVDGHSVSSPSTIVKRALSVGGIRSLWLGLGPMLARDVPFSAFYWFGYEQIKQQFIIIFNSSPTTATTTSSSEYVINFLSGAGSGGIASILTNPLDVLKTRMQVQIQDLKRNQSNSNSTTTRLSSFQIGKQIWNEEGIAGFFTGLKARMIRVPISCAVMISTYEMMKKIVF